MKLLIWPCLFFSLSAHAVKEGHGGDIFDSLFDEAKDHLVKKMESIDLENLKNLTIKNHYKDWLRQEIKDVTGSPWIRLTLLTERLSSIQFEFVDKNGCAKKQPLCFKPYNPEVDNFPVVIVSKQEALEQKILDINAAAPLVLHEAGHFTGEMDHNFLGKFSVDFYKSNIQKKSSKIFTATSRYVDWSYQPCTEAKVGAIDGAILKCAQDQEVSFEDCPKSGVDKRIFTNLVSSGYDGAKSRYYCEVTATIKLF